MNGQHRPDPTPIDFDEHGEGWGIDSYGIDFELRIRPIRERSILLWVSGHDQRGETWLTVDQAREVIAQLHRACADVEHRHPTPRGQS